ncbi:S1/P1 nuclease [Hymenobacter latericus]|uniref:S1/P1 nuclease n=1 Tax=Hymenobacter sp. YIM 151858-1 TaxID=2987688 RepID=UPI0022275981|nr:S1/P1 nuclease [Hymenobacter sp. YIM 151858-1]UYZ59954.1 S1/P1 nuclease [Hymenobacter sp. YIM 151858-1]
MSPLQLMAWGGEGHRTVGKIAERHLSRKASRQVEQLLGNQTLADVSTWADEVRNTPEYRSTAPWHFVNLPLGLEFPAFNQELKAKTEPNAYQALNENIRLLADKKQPQEKRQIALKFVVHLVGDLHQPMHISRAEDKGGNDIQLQFRGEGTNLHRLWDSGLINVQGLAYQQMAANLQQPDDKQAKIWRRDPMEQWFFQSYQLSSKLYEEAQPGTVLEEQYYNTHIEDVRLRLSQAGIRLAEVLNEALD